MSWDQRNQIVGVKNTSGERIPPYAAMEISYSGTSGAALNSAGDVIWNVKKPTSVGAADPSRIIVNGHQWIEIDRWGSGVFNSRGLVLCDASTVSPLVGFPIGPIAGQWSMAVGGRGWVYKSNDVSPGAYEFSASIRSAYADYVGPGYKPEWVGYLYESYRGVVAGMWVVPSIPLVGPLPPFSRVYVYNIYKWNFGLIGGTYRAEADFTNNRWIGLQQEYTCPDSRSIDPQTPPPVDDSLSSGEE